MKAPTSNAISQTSHGLYKAVDYRAIPDPKIYAPEAGKITFRGSEGNCGNKLWLEGATGRHTFCHLSFFNVALNQNVSQGQVLGTMGNTGLSTGPHLHWALRLTNGEWVYPPSKVGGSMTEDQKRVEELEHLVDELRAEVERLEHIIDKLNAPLKILAPGKYEVK